MDLGLAHPHERLGAVRRLRHDAQVGLAVEHQTQAAPHHHVIVGDQQPGRERHRHGARSGRSVNRTAVPLPWLESTSSSAPTSTARSRIPRSPAPAARRGSNP